MNKIFFFLIIILIIIASWFIFDLSKYLPPDFIFHKGIKYKSEEVQRKISKALRERNIPHRINNDGFIEYRKKDDKKIKQIADKISSEYYSYYQTSPEIDEILEKSRGLIIANQFDDALELFNKGISKYNKSSILYNNRVLVWSFKGENDKAIADYTKAIELSPNDHAAYTNRAMAWSRKNEYERAIQDFTISINLFFKDAQSHFYRAFAFSKLNQFQKALLDYKNAIKLDTKWAEGSFRTDIPTDPIYLFALAEHFAESGNFEKAIVVQERAIELLQKESNTNGIVKYQKRLECYKNKELCKE